MAVFIDANVVTYTSTVPDRPLGAACFAILEAVEDGRLDARTSVAVLEEILHLELRGRPAGLGGAAADAYALFTPLLPVTDEIIRAALSLNGGSLGSNDRVHVATCRANGIETIVSTDSDFDGVAGLRRIDPLDREAVAELLRDD